MPKNRIVKQFSTDGSWTAPGGVTKISIMVKELLHKNVNETCLLSGNDVQGVLTPDGRAFVFGSGATGKLGQLSNRANQSIPVRWGTELFNEKLISFGTWGITGVVALSESGHFYACGSGNYIGQNTAASFSSPVRSIVNFPISSVASFGWGFFIDTDGNGYASGIGTSGQLGTGATTNQSSPVPIAGGLTWKKLIGGGVSSYGLDTDGQVWAWGNGGTGKLGTGTTNNASSPVQVLTPGPAIDIAGSYAGYLIDENNDLWSWGSNSGGALGIDAAATMSSPVQVVGGKKWKRIACNESTSVFAMGIDTDDELWSIGGFNLNGRSGTGAGHNSSPIIVQGGLKWADVKISDESCIGITLDGRVFVWGNNNVGQLGNGDVTLRTSPVEIGNTSIWNFNMSNDLLINRSEIEVTPGTTYNISIEGLQATFNDQIIATAKRSKLMEIIYYS